MLRRIFLVDFFILLLGVFNVLALFPQFVPFQNIFNTFYLLFTPGYLIYLSVHKRTSSISECFLFSAILSIAFLYGIGLILTLIFLTIGLRDTLDTFSILIAFDIGVLILFVIAIIRTNWFTFPFTIPSISIPNMFMTFIPMLFLLLSIGGAIRLNNGASNILTMVMLGLMGLYIISASLYGRKNTFDFTVPIYFMSASLLLMLSLRGNFVTGWDIQEESVKFIQTMLQNQWSTAIDNSAYNSCLSITMLPTIVSKITSISPEYTFKVVFQFIFAFMPVSIYLLMRQHVDKATSFLAVIYILSQSIFIQPMVSIVRQEIAFLFFAMILFGLFAKNIHGWKRIFFITVSVICMVVSHYSTSYMAILIFTLTFTFFLVYRFLLRFKRIQSIFQFMRVYDGTSPHLSHVITIPFLILLIGSTFMWYNVLNHSTDNLYNIAVETVTNFSETFQPKPKSQAATATFTLFSKDKNNTVKLVNQFIKEKTKVYQSYYLHHYPPASYKDFKVVQHFPKDVTPTIDTFLNKNVILFFELIKQSAKLLLIIGTTYVFLFVFRKNESNKEYLLIAVTSLLLIVVILFHPTLSLRYNISRTYIQLLCVLSLHGIYGLYALTFSFRKSIQIGLSSLVLCCFFLYSHGFVNQILGGPSYMQLNNAGDDYEKFFIHSSEIAAGYWMKQNTDTMLPTFADAEANLRLYKTGNKFALPAILPQFIQRQGYVYADYSNVINGRTYLNYNGTALYYKYPIKFLNENKNLIYSTKETQIYR